MRPRKETEQSIVMTSKVRSVWCSYLALLLGPLQDPLLNGTLHNQSVDCHLFSLSQTMGSVHCLRTQKTILTQQYTARIKCTPPNEGIIPNNHLLVNCWVPITVIEYHLYKRNKLLSTTLVPDNKRLLHLSEFRPLTVSVLAGAATAIVLYFGGVDALAGAITPGEWFLFITSIEIFWFPLTSIASFWSQFQLGMSAAERVFALIDAEPRVVQNDRRPVERLQGRIRFENVDFRYSEKEQVLAQFSLDLQPGETVALVGHTGAGKSSIGKLVARFYIGSEHLRCGEIDAARRELEHAADIYPPCLFDLGLLHFQQGEHARAATWLRRGFAANPYVGQMLWAEHEWGGVETPRALRVWLGTNLREADTATEYVQRYWRLWLTTANALDFGHWLENEPEVMRERARGLELDRALLWEHEIEARRRIIAERGEFREGIDDTLSERLISLRTTSDGAKVQPWMYPEYRDGEPQY